MMALAEERGSLENELLRSQIARMRQEPAPGVPGSRYLLDGQSQSGLVVDQPLLRVAAGENESAEAGAVTDVGYTRTPGGWGVVPSYDAVQRSEDFLVPQLQWMVRNNFLPMFQGERMRRNAPPLGDRQRSWVFNPFTGEYSEWKGSGAGVVNWLRARALWRGRRRP